MAKDRGNRPPRREPKRRGTPTWSAALHEVRLEDRAATARGIQQYRYFYASGGWYRATGTFRLLPLGDLLCPAIELHDRRQVLILDQRTIVFAEDRRVVYEPARHRSRLTPEMREWLDGHPEWVASSIAIDERN